jgi:hypothetical protein
VPLFSKSGAKIRKKIDICKFFGKNRERKTGKGEREIENLELRIEN